MPTVIHRSSFIVHRLRQRAPSTRRAAFTATRRSGISLLEVLASILVLSVGILAMAALIPVGAHEISEANKLDSSSTLGRAAFRDLEVRGLMQPGGTLDSSIPPVNQYAWMTFVANGTPANRWNFVGPGNMPRNGVLVFDPMMVASVESLRANEGRVRTFPYSYCPPTSITDPTIAPTMYGFTNLNSLASALGLGTALGTGGTMPPPPQPLPVGSPLAQSELLAPRMTFNVVTNPPLVIPPALAVMPPALAERVFRSSDDLVFIPPNVDIAPATLGAPPQVKRTRPVLTHETPTGGAVNYDGAYSWFYTLAPAHGDWIINGGQTHQFTLSVVTCNNRTLTVPPEFLTAAPNMPPASPPPPERMLAVAMIGGGLGGGEVLICVGPGNVASPADYAAWLDFKPGQWLMLSAQNPNTFQVYCDWYRIVAVDSEAQYDAGSKASYRFITLQGADWPQAAPPPYGPGGPITDASGNIMVTYATVVDGVVGVFQKTITLDGTSAWSSGSR